MSREQEYYAFSVIMAVYNVENYLHEAIDSLITQDFGFENIQLILIDDGSSDRSGEICEKYRAKYPNNIVLVHKENGGVASARNEGLKYATGRFLNFMDSDDKMSRDAFRKVYQFFCLHEEETDVVTIPIELFDGANAPHWQNWKFEQGSRVIDLHEEYHTTVMFVTASFFRAQVKDKIHFDSRLVVAEDVKVLLTVLADKMTLGVVDECRFFYRRRRTKNGLIQTSRKKRGWYFDYFDYFIDWALAFYTEKFGATPGFLQYELLSDLQWRILEKPEMDTILSEQEQQHYKERLFRTFRTFEDKYILEQRLLKEYHKCFILEKKYNCTPDIIIKRDDVFFKYGITEVKPLSQQPVELEFIKLTNNDCSVEGAVRIHGFRPEGLRLDVKLEINNEVFQCRCYRREIDDCLCFGEIAQWTLGFQGSFKPAEMSLPLTVRLFIQYQDMTVFPNNILYGEFAPIGQYPTSYYRSKGLDIKPLKDGFQISKSRPGMLLGAEVRFLQELWRANDEGTRKAIPVRLAYHLIRRIKKKPVWLLSDRILKAGDNGEALYQYLLKETSGKIDLRFAISPDSPDYARIRQMGKTVPIPSFRYKLLYLLSEYVISSHADDINAKPFHGHQEGYRDILADKKFVFLQHGVTMNDVSDWLARQHRNLYGFVTTALPEFESIINGSYGYTEENVWLTGFPRYDYLPEADVKGRLITIAPTWRAYLAPSWNYNTGERILAEDFHSSEYLKYYNRLLNHSRLLTAAQKYGYHIAFYPHPNLQTYLDAFQRNEQVLFLGKEYNYRNMYESSCLMVTDYSSAVFDFAYMGKPVIYTQFDKDQFFSGGHICKTGYFDYETAGFGEVKYDLESTVDCMIEYMASGCQMKEIYKKRVDSFFAYYDRQNCQRVVSLGMQW